MRRSPPDAEQREQPTASRNAPQAARPRPGSLAQGPRCHPAALPPSCFVFQPPVAAPSQHDAQGCVVARGRATPSTRRSLAPWSSCGRRGCRSCSGTAWRPAPRRRWCSAARPPRACPSSACTGPRWLAARVLVARCPADATRRCGAGALRGPQRTCCVAPCALRRRDDAFLMLVAGLVRHLHVAHAAQGRLPTAETLQAPELKMQVSKRRGPLPPSRDSSVRPLARPACCARWRHLRLHRRHTLAMPLVAVPCCFPARRRRQRDARSGGLQQAAGGAAGAPPGRARQPGAGARRRPQRAVASGNPQGVRRGGRARARERCACSRGVLAQHLRSHRPEGEGAHDWITHCPTC